MVNQVRYIIGNKLTDEQIESRIKEIQKGSGNGTFDAMLANMPNWKIRVAEIERHIHILNEEKFDLYSKMSDCKSRVVELFDLEQK